ncbi:MAG: hypothetical protein GY859_33525 [Desulfobacterales bacterium]|nr:hypothetical protein [Desulfobacterales bacterium]
MIEFIQDQTLHEKNCIAAVEQRLMDYYDRICLFTDYETYLHGQRGGPKRK